MMEEEDNQYKKQETNIESSQSKHHAQRWIGIKSNKDSCADSTQVYEKKEKLLKGAAGAMRRLRATSSLLVVMHSYLKLYPDLPMTSATYS